MHSSKSTSGNLACGAGLWVNESLPYIQSSVFAVNQMASVWDSQCILEGQAVDNVLQMGCSVNNHYERAYRTCNQYP